MKEITRMFNPQEKARIRFSIKRMKDFKSMDDLEKIQALEFLDTCKRDIEELAYHIHKSIK